MAEPMIAPVADPLWDAYCGARFMALGAPATDLEQAAEQRARKTLTRCLDLDAATAAYQASRCVLFRRELVLHDYLAINLAPAALNQILDAIEVVGLEHAGGRAGGTILLSLHYSLYSNWLGLWLARATARGLFSHLDIIVLSTPAGSLRLSQRRTADLGRAGIWDDRTRLVDRRLTGNAVAARTLLDRLRAGGAVMVLPDASLLPAAGRRTIAVLVGRQYVGLPRGPAWLVRLSGAHVVPVHIRPCSDDHHSIVFGSPARPGPEADADTFMQAIVQRLLDQTVATDPAPWEGWFRDGLRAQVAMT